MGRAAGAARSQGWGCLDSGSSGEHSHSPRPRGRHFRLLLQNPPTLLQFPQEEYNVPFKPDLQPSPLPAESRVSGSGGVFLEGAGGFCSGRTRTRNPPCTPTSPAPLGSPRAWNAAGSWPSRTWSPPHADRHRAERTGGGAGGRSAAEASVSETASAHAPAEALRPHDLTEPPRRLLGVGIVSYRWGNRGAERVDGWLESVSGWRAAFSSTPPPRGGAGRSSPSSPTPLPWPCWVPGWGPQPRSPALVSHLPLCRRPRGLGLLLSVLSFQAQEAGASNVW